MAPAFSAQALAVFADKKNVRLLKLPLGEASNAYDLKRVGGGLLVQSPDDHRIKAADLRVVTSKQPTAEQMNDLLFAWQVAKVCQVECNRILRAR